MAITVIASVGAASADRNTITTAGIDTTGANLIVLVRSDFGASRATISDSKGNSWTALTTTSSAGTGACTIFYSIPSSVGAAHTFTATQANSFPAIQVLAVAGATAINPADQEAGAAFNTVTTAQPGSITPSQNDCLVVLGGTWDTSTQPASLAVNSSYNLTTTNIANTNHEGSGLAYIIQTVAAATNPAWSWAANAVGATRIASFKAAQGVGLTDNSQDDEDMADSYSWYQKTYSRKIADVDILTGTASYADVLTPKSANHQLFIQRITLSITTHAADVYTVDDDGAGPPFAVHTDAAAAAGIPSVVTWNFGPAGRPVTKGANVDVSHSSTGVAVMHIEGYERLIGPVAPATTN